MFKYLQYMLAYIFLIFFWLIFIFILLRIFDVIDSDGGSIGLMLVGFGFHYIYDKYKPMEFKDLIKLIKIKYSTFVHKR